MEEKIQDTEAIDIESFRNEIDKQRKVKFKIARCPKVIYDQFKDFALKEAGDLYPAALSILLERSKAYNNSLHIYNEIEEIKQYVAYLQGEIEQLQLVPVQKEAARRAFKSFGASPTEIEDTSKNGEHKNE